MDIDRLLALAALGDDPAINAEIARHRLREGERPDGASVRVGKEAWIVAMYILATEPIDDARDGYMRRLLASFNGGASLDPVAEVTHPDLGLTWGVSQNGKLHVGAGPNLTPVTPAKAAEMLSAAPLCTACAAGLRRSWRSVVLRHGPVDNRCATNRVRGRKVTMVRGNLSTERTALVRWTPGRQQ